MMPTLTRPHIRWLIRRDMPEVLSIERRSFEYAWDEKDFLRALRQRNCIGMVAEVKSGGDWPVVGFMLYELHEKKLHLANFAVHPDWRRQHVGAQMVAKLIGKLSSHRRARITVDVRESNLPAQCFFRAQGFLAVRTMAGFYRDANEDAYRFVYRTP